MQSLDWKKYLLAFFITAAIFGTAFYVAARFDRQRIASIQATEERIALDILSLETQYDLLGELECSIISANPLLSQELNALASQLSIAEQNLGTDNLQVISLKKQYSLLQIKDYILMQKISQKCGTKPVAILYFYSNEGDCPDCSRAGDVLTYLRQEYPGLRVYSFDYNLDLSALKTLIALKNVAPTLPALIVGTRPTIYGFRDVNELQALAPEIKKLSTTTPAATTR